jgi:hypothetical protein
MSAEKSRRICDVCREVHSVFATPAGKSQRRIATPAGEVMALVFKGYLYV